MIDAIVSFILASLLRAIAVLCIVIMVYEEEYGNALLVAAIAWTTANVTDRHIRLPTNKSSEPENEETEEVQWENLL